jgi:hypothetical protein
MSRSRVRAMRSRFGAEGGYGNEDIAGHWKTVGRWDRLVHLSCWKPWASQASSNMQLLKGALDMEGAWRPVALTLPRSSLTWGYKLHHQHYHHLLPIHLSHFELGTAWLGQSYGLVTVEMVCLRKTTSGIRNGYSKGNTEDMETRHA